jgi:hypothetical protein
MVGVATCSGPGVDARSGPTSRRWLLVWMLPDAAAGGCRDRRHGAVARRAAVGVPGMSLRSEVEVLDWGPDRGNPTSMRQGRGLEITGRLQCGCVRCGASVRAGLKEAVDAWWWRTRVKRRKASLAGELACGSDARFLLVPGTYWRRDHREISTTYPGRSAGFRPRGRWAEGRKDDG